MKDIRVFIGDEFLVNGRTFKLDYLEENINMGSEFVVYEHSCMCLQMGKYSTVSFDHVGRI
jgi:hypothetical protein